MTRFFKGFSKVVNIWPDTDYCEYLPTRPVSVEAWEQVGKRLSSSILIAAIQNNIEPGEQKKLDFIIKLLNEKEASPDNYLNPAIINEQKKRERERKYPIREFNQCK